MNGSLRNFRIVSVGPDTASGGMMAFTREPSGRRASTIGEASSTRRPMRLMILSMIRSRCWSSTNWAFVLRQLAAALDVDPARAVDHDLGHGLVAQERLERAVAEDVVGDLERDRGRAPGASAASCRGRSPPRPTRARGRRARRSASSSAAVNRRGPSRVITSWWTRVFSSANGSATPCGLGLLADWTAGPGGLRSRGGGLDAGLEAHGLAHAAFRLSLMPGAAASPALGRLGDGVVALRDRRALLRHAGRRRGRPTAFVTASAAPTSAPARRG